jgi:type IV pilus assembly protein PilM
MIREKSNSNIDTIPAKNRTFKKRIKGSFAKNNYLKNPEDIFISNQSGFLNKLLYPESIAIEIDPGEMRILNIRKIKQKYQIERWSEVELKRNGTDRITKIFQTIQSVLDVHQIKHKKIFLIINGPEVNIRTFTVPKLKGKELKEAIYWKNKNEISNFSDAFICEFEVLGERKRGDKSELLVQSTVSPERFVNKYLNILKEIGIEPFRVIVKPFALSSAIHFLTNAWTLKKKNTVFIDIGREIMLLCFFRNGRLEFVRTLLLGSSKIDRMLTKPIKIKEKEVSLKEVMIERYKRRYGILREFLNGTDKRFFPFNRLYEYILPTLRLFVSEINRSLTFYKNKYQVNKIDSIFLTGKGCNLKNLDLFLSAKLQLPVHLIAPSFPSVNWGKYLLGFEYTSCFGALVDSDKNSNFIPQAIKTEKSYKKKLKLLLLICSFLLILISTYSIHLHKERRNLEGAVSQLDSEYQNLSYSEKKVEDMLKQTKELDRRINLGHATINKDTKIVDILKILSNATHNDIVLSSIEYNFADISVSSDNIKKAAGVITIKGNVYKNFLSADIILLKYISTLKSYNYFSDVQLIEEKKQIYDKIFLFKIQLKV